MASINFSGVALSRRTLDTGPGKNPGEAIGVDNYKEITFFLEYTRNALGGGVDAYVEASNDKVHWYQVAEIQTPAITPGSDVVLDTQRASFSYEATGPSTERFTSPTFSCVGHFMRLSVGELSGTGGEAFAEYMMRGDNA